MIIVNALTKYW